MKIFSCAFLLACTLTHSSNSQDNPPGHRAFDFGEKLTLDKVHIYVHLGIAGHLSGGKGITNFHDNVGKVDSRDEYHTYSDRVEGLISPVIGGRAGITLNDQFEGGVGLQYSRLGFSMHSDATYRDPEYQFDAVGRYSSTLRIDVLGIPIWALYSINENIRLGGGFIGGITLGGSARMKYHYDVYTNGSWDREYSFQEHRRTYKIRDVAKRFFPGLFADVIYKLPFRWPVKARGGIQYTSKYTDWPEGDISLWSLELGFIYPLH